MNETLFLCCSGTNPEIDRGQITLKKIKKGAEEFWDVWEGNWKGASPVAVKVFKPGKVSTSKLLQEVTQMRKLNHPNLVKVYGVCTKKEPIYFVMELMNESLPDYLHDNGNVTLSQLIDIAAQVAAGMAYLEKENCMHGTLTARDVFLGENGVYKVAGFGLFRTIIEKKFPIKWTAPEAALYDRFSIKSDVWSFGIVLAEIITNGQIPYPGIRNADVLELTTLKGYRMPCPPGCPAKLYNIMLACWKDDPDSRLTFQTLQWQLEEFFTTDEDGYTNPDK